MRNFKRFLLFVLLKFVKGEIQGGCFRSQEVSEGGKVTEYCLECDRGYAQEIIKTTSTGEKYVNCKKCLIENCDICEFQTPEKCTSCLNKFFLKENSCLNCPKECWKCNNLDECEECDTGYFFRLGSTTPKKCEKCIENCMKCTTDKNCDECEAFFKYDDNAKECKETSIINSKFGFFLVIVLVLSLLCGICIIVANCSKKSKEKNDNRERPYKKNNNQEN